MALLELQNFSCGYGEMIAVCDLAVEPGQILALLGPNGAGKTSTILTITGHMQIKAGSLSVAGNDITRTAALKRVEQNTALALDVAHEVCVLALGRSVFTGSEIGRAHV